MSGLRFPTQERVEAGVSYREMLGEFGWGSAYIVSFLLIMGISQMLTVFDDTSTTINIPHCAAACALIPTVLFAIFIRSFGRPMFVFLMLVMFLLATTELGTDGWIQDIMRSVLEGPDERHAVPGLHGGDHVRAAVLRRADRAPHFAAGPVGRMLRDCRRRLVLAGQRRSERRHAVPRRDAVRRRQDILLADDAGPGLRAISRAAARCC